MVVVVVVVMMMVVVVVVVVGDDDDDDDDDVWSEQGISLRNVQCDYFLLPVLLHTKKTRITEEVRQQGVMCAGST